MYSNGVDPDFQFRFRNLMSSIESGETFGSLRILHGYWDKLTKARLNGHWPLSAENRQSADKLMATPGMISSGFAEELNRFLGSDNDPSGLNLSISTIAGPKMAKLEIKESPSLETLRKITDRPIDSIGATLPKYLVETNQFSELIEGLSDLDVLVVGPAFLTTCDISIGRNLQFIDIPEWEAYLVYEKIISVVESTLAKHPQINCVIFSAGTIPTVIASRLFEKFPGVKWLDLGIALSVFNPDGIYYLPWFADNYVSIMRTFDQFGLSFDKDKDRSSERLIAEKDLFQELRRFMLSYKGERDNEVINNYEQARENLIDLPQLRLNMLNLICKFPGTQSMSFLEDSCKWEIDNLSRNSFSSKLLLASLIQNFPQLHEDFIFLCNELSRLSPNDYRSRLLKTQNYLNSGELGLARNTFQEELKSNFSEFRQIKKIEKQLS